MRILHKLDRFSEDLDFSLIQQTKAFDIKKYLGALKSELELWGFEVSTEEKEKHDRFCFHQSKRIGSFI